jgi:hypothetical protein
MLPPLPMSIFRSCPVNRLQVCEVEFSFQRRFRKLVSACRRESGLGLFESGFVGDAQSVF